MWQRIQTLFLIVAFVCLVTSLFFPIWMHQSEQAQKHVLTPMYYTETQNAVEKIQYFPYSVTAILAIASATLAFIGIRKYKNRVLQMKLGALNSLFMAGTIASAVIFSNQLLKTFQGGQYGLALWLPGVAVICNLIANQFIRRDERIVRNSDRLR